MEEKIKNLPFLARHNKLREIMQRICTLQEITDEELHVSSLIKEILEDECVIEAIDVGKYKVNITEEHVKEAIEIVEDEEIREEIEKQESKKVEEEFLDWVEVTSEDIVEFEQILQDNDALEYLHPYVCPKLEKLDMQKKAILLALASHWDSGGDRWRIHVLMHGEESSGTAKTPLLRWIKEIGGAYASMRSTKAGLTVNLKDGSPGLLPRKHHSAVSVDEIDKLDKKDRDGLLGAMEEGVIPYEAADESGEYPAEVIAIGGANRADFFTPEQFLRWDFRFHIAGYTVDEAQQIADTISMWMGKERTKETEKLVKFLKWIRSREAGMSDEVRKEGAELIKEYIRRSENTDPRRMQAIWRVARAWARLNHLDVTGKDVAKAIVMLEELDSIPFVISI